RKFGSTSAAITVACGSSSCRSPNRFASNAALQKLTPVALPPGRLKLATRPSFTGSAPVKKTIGMIEVAVFAAIAGGVFPTITATWRCTSSAAKPGSRSYWPPGQQYCPRHFRPLKNPCAPQALAEGGYKGRRFACRLPCIDESDPRHRPLLRARRERPRRRGAAEKRDELASFHPRAHS